MRAPSRVASHGVNLGEHERPCGAVLIERARSEPNQQTLLGVVEDPIEIPVGRHIGNQRGVQLPRGAPERGPRPGQVTLSQLYHRAILKEVQMWGRKLQGAIEGPLSLPIRRE